MEMISGISFTQESNDQIQSGSKVPFHSDFLVD